MKISVRLRPSRLRSRLEQASFGVKAARSTATRGRWLLVAAVFAGACSTEPRPAPNPPAASTVPTQQQPIGRLPDIDMAALLQHTKVLSSDEYEGRAPGTRGEDLSVRYLEDQFKRAGLKPGNTNGTYVQKVPLVGITPTPAPLVI